MGRGYVKHRPERAPDLATEAHVQAMQAKLAARLNRNQAASASSGAGDDAPTPRGSLPNSLGTSSTPQAVQSAQPKSAVKLEWERPTKDAMAVKTKCGRYSCAKVVVMGKVSYELWKIAPGGGWFNQLHKGLDNFLQAQELARQDAQKHA